MAPILRRAGSIATGGKHREYRIECNHKGPRFVVSTTALQLWLNGKRNRGSRQDVFCNNFNCLCHLQHLTATWVILTASEAPDSLRAAFQSPQPPEWTSFPIPRQPLKMTARAPGRQRGVTPPVGGRAYDGG